LPKLEIFDPPLCCSSGVCGPSVDPALLKFAGALAWLRRQGVVIERRNLAQEPEAFAACAAVKRLLDERGEKALPVTLVDGRVIGVGAYPAKEELAAATGVKMRPLPTAIVPEGGPCA
jgi:Arsenical resistance operon protein ArsD